MMIVMMIVYNSPITSFLSLATGSVRPFLVSLARLYNYSEQSKLVASNAKLLDLLTCCNKFCYYGSLKEKILVAGMTGLFASLFLKL